MIRKKITTEIHYFKGRKMWTFIRIEKEYEYKKFCKIINSFYSKIFKDYYKCDVSVIKNDRIEISLIFKYTDKQNGTHALYKNNNGNIKFTKDGSEFLKSLSSIYNFKRYAKYYNIGNTQYVKVKCGVNKNVLMEPFKKYNYLDIYLTQNNENTITVNIFTIPKKNYRSILSNTPKLSVSDQTYSETLKV